MPETTEASLTTTDGKVSRYEFSAPVLYQVMSSLVLVFCVFGLVGNSLSAIILTKMETSAGNTRLLRYLNYVDIMLLVLGYVDFAMGMIDPNKNMEDWIRQLLLPVAHPLALSVYTVEIYLTVLIAVQRGVIVARPLYKGCFSNNTFVCKIFVLIIILGFAFNIPHWLAYPPEVYWEPKLNTTWFRNDLSEFGRNYWYRPVYSGYITLVVRTLVPMLILLAANFVIVRSLRLSAVQRREMVSSKSESNTGKTTAIILAITSMSVATHFTSASVRILMEFWENDTNIAREAFVSFSTLLIMINSSSNFIFYCSFGKEFRKTMRRLCS